MKSKLPGRLIFISLCIALIACMVVNWQLFKQGEQYYLELHETRLDPLGLSVFPPKVNQSVVSGSTKPIVVFFGDSRAAQWPAPTHLTQFTFVNRGIGAQTSVQALGRFDDHVKPLHPRIMIVQVGINDLKTIPLFPARKAAIMADCKDDIRQIVSRAVADGATVILTTIFPSGKVPPERLYFWSADVDRAIVEVNDDIRSLKSSQVIIFDAYEILSEHGMLKEAYARDQLHLNQMGYDALNRELINVLASVN